MGRDRKERSIRNQQEDQRNKDRYHDRQARNVGQDKRGLVLHDGAGPLNQGTRFRLPVVTGLPVAAAVEVKAAALGLLKIEVAGIANEPTHQTDTDEQAGHHDEQARGPTRPSRGMHDAEQIVHEPAFTQEGGHSTKGQEKLSTDGCSRVLQRATQSVSPSCPEHFQTYLLESEPTDPVDDGDKPF